MNDKVGLTVGAVRRVNVAGAIHISTVLLEHQGPWAPVEWVYLRSDDEPEYYLRLLKSVFKVLKDNHRRAASAVAREIVRLRPEEEHIVTWLSRYSR